MIFPEILTVVAWVMLAGCGVAASAFFSGMETGIYVLNKIRLELRAESGSAPARLLRNMLARSDNMLAVLLIGTNLAAYGVTFIVGAMYARAGGGSVAAEWYTLATVTPILFVFGESVPKNVFQRLAETVVYRFARVFWLSSVVFNACGLAPLVRGVAAAMMWLTRARGEARWPRAHEVATVMDEGRASGALTHSQSIMADRVMRIADVTLGRVMIPMKSVICAPAAAGAGRLGSLMREHNYSRVPLLDGAGRVVGVADSYDVLATADDSPVAPGAAPVVLPAGVTVTDGLYRMQRAGVEMVAVADADGSHVGIVTIKDLVEEIVGEIHEW